VSAGGDGGGTAAVDRAVADAHRREWAFVLAATARAAGDFDLAEECVQDAYVAALDAWARDGVPRKPGAWLTATAKRKALDVLRRERVFRSKMPLLVEPDEAEMDEPEEDAVPDDRLRLIFTCCHPALAREAQVALTLHLVCGVSTGDIARAFLVSEPTMAAGDPGQEEDLRGPDPVPGTGRQRAARAAGRGADRHPSALHDRAHGAVRYRPGPRRPGGPRAEPDPHAPGPDARRAGGPRAPRAVAGNRCPPGHPDRHRGRLLVLEDQDRSAWDRAAIDEGRRLVVDAFRTGRVGRYALQAAIASLHAVAGSYATTDWRQVLGLYDELLKVWPSPVVALNRAVAVSMVRGPDAALDEIEILERDGRLAGYHYLPAVRADLLRRLGRHREAATAYRAALDLPDSEAERVFLAARLAEAVDSGSDRSPEG
jgi:RNA polymerase sigma-70 factor (ECF subfamily)